MKSEKLKQNAKPCPSGQPGAPVMAFDSSDARTIADVIVRNALKWVSGRTQYPLHQVVAALKRGDRTAQRELKLGLARHLAAQLGFLDEHVKAVFVADELGSYSHDQTKAGRRWTVHLVVYADPKTAALASLVNALHRALQLVLQELGVGAQSERFLYMQIVNRAGLENLARYTALLTAPGYLQTRVGEHEGRESDPAKRGQRVST